MSQAAATQTRLSPADRDALAVATWSCQRDPAYLEAMVALRTAAVADDEVAYARAELRAWVSLFAARAADLSAFAAGLPVGLLRDRAEAAAKKATAAHTRKAATLAKRAV